MSGEREQCFMLLRGVTFACVRVSFALHLAAALCTHTNVDHVPCFLCVFLARNTPTTQQQLLQAQEEGAQHSMGTYGTGTLASFDDDDDGDDSGDGYGATLGAQTQGVFEERDVEGWLVGLLHGNARPMEWGVYV